MTEPPVERQPPSEKTVPSEAAEFSSLPLDASDGPDIHGLTTGRAPSFRSLIPSTSVSTPSVLPVYPSPGQRLDDFGRLQEAMEIGQNQ